MIVPQWLQFKPYHPPIVKYAGLIAVVVSIFFMPNELWVGTLISYSLMVGIGLSCGFHLLFCHNSYDSPNWWRRICFYFGTISNMSPCAIWVAFHRLHHQFVDSPLDPAGRNLFSFKPYEHNTEEKKNIKRAMVKVLREPFMKFSMKWHSIIVLATILLLTLIGFITNQLWLPVALWLIPASLANWVFDIHSNIGHAKEPYLGTYKRYRNEQSGDALNFLWFIPAFTDVVFHNNHHANPKRWHSAERWWEWMFDWPAWIIWLVKK